MKPAYAIALLSVCVIAPACLQPRVTQANVARVRLDVAERALGRASETYATAVRSPDAAARLGAARGECATWHCLYEALLAARESMARAEEGARAWLEGDGRKWARAEPCLAHDLVRVQAGLVALGLDVPPGLVEGIRVDPDEPCLDRETSPPAEPSAPQDHAGVQMQIQ